MEREFISDVTFDLETIRELNNHMSPTWYRWLIRVIAALLTVLVVWGILVYPENLKYYAGVYFIIATVSYLRNKDGGSKYQKLLEENSGHAKRNMIRITDSGIHYWNPETGNTVDVDFSEVNAITRTRRFLVLTLTDGSSHLINHSNVTGGTAADLEAFLREKCGAGRIWVRRDDEQIRKFLFIVMAIGFLWSFFGVYNGFRPQPEVKTYHEAAEVLEKLGIDAPDEELLTELEEYGASEWTVMDLLYFAGAGEYDDETWKWTPAQSGVYSFDVEVFELSMMYTNFLHGVAAASGGELEFSDITEDDAMVDWEAGTGIKTVTFTFEGKTYTLRPDVMNDWFDIGFANEIAHIVGTGEDGKRLYFLYDGYQMVSIFYRDADWAREFTRKTGFALSTKL